MKRIKNFLLSLSIIGITILSSHLNVQAKNIEITRYQGSNRYETCATISKASYTDSAYAMIVSGENYPDSIVSSPLAYKMEAPILLVQKNNIPTCIKNELKRLNVKRVFIVGGTGSVSKNVENQLKTMGIQIYKRIAGKNRYETSAKMEHYLISDEDHEYFVADGDEWQDVLLLSLVANQKQSPVFLNDICHTPECIRPKNLKRNYIKATMFTNTSYDSMGRYALEEDIGIHSYNLITGSMSTDKNLAIREHYKGGYMRMNDIYLTSSKGFADSLSISTIVSAHNGSLFFVDEKNKDIIKDYIISHHGGDVNSITVIGGKSLISDSYVNDIIDGINNTNASDTIKDEHKFIHLF